MVKLGNGKNERLFELRSSHSATVLRSYKASLLTDDLGF